MIDLNQLLKAEKRYKRFDDQHPRSYERHSLESAVGSMRYRGVQVSCQVLDISMGGCCIETERLFDIGALAHVEIEISIFGLNLRIVGVIQWTEDNLIGVRFFHPGVKTKNQVASIISCLIDHGTIESVQAALAAAEAQKPEKEKRGEERIEIASVSLEAVRKVHRDQRVVRTPKPGHWPFETQAVEAALGLAGYITELSLDGLTVQLSEPFRGRLDQPMEMSFELGGLNFRVIGIPRAVHDGTVLGFQFGVMNARRRDELAQAIEEIAAANPKPGI